MDTFEIQSSKNTFVSIDVPENGSVEITFGEGGFIKIVNENKDNTISVKSTEDLKIKIMYPREIEDKTDDNGEVNEEDNKKDKTDDNEEDKTDETVEDKINEELEVIYHQTRIGGYYSIGPYKFTLKYDSIKTFTIESAHLEDVIILLNNKLAKYGPYSLCFDDDDYDDDEVDGSLIKLKYRSQSDAMAYYEAMLSLCD